MKVILAAHVVIDKGYENRGPAHILEDYLIKNKIPYDFLKYPLLDFSFFLSHLLTILRTICFVFKDKSKEIVFIGVDPLNALSGLILRKIGKVSFFVFHTPDYSPKRFSNSIINKIYHLIDIFCAKNADLIICVSERIMKKRISQGIDSKKVYWVPNSPLEFVMPEVTKKDRFDLVLLANLGSAVAFTPFIEALKILKDRANLVIIGSGKGEPLIREKAAELGVLGNIDFKGWLPYDKAIKEVRRVAIGLAFYDNRASYTYYCDPVKVRDYLSCGLPVIMNDVPAVAEEIKAYRAGIVVENTAEEIARAYFEIIKNYGEYSRNAFKLANDRHSGKYLDLVFAKIKEELK